MTSKNILIAINSGIIGLDIKKQLIGSGYKAEVIDLISKENLKEKLDQHFQLMILEKRINNEGIEYAVQLAHEYKLPLIFLSTDNYLKKNETDGNRIIMMPFDGDDLKKNVKIALGEK